MKKTIVASLAFTLLMSCNNAANDGDATTDTTNFNTMPDTSSAPLGDTTLKMNDQGTLSNPDTRTDVDPRRSPDTAGDSM